MIKIDGKLIALAAAAVPDAGQEIFDLMPPAHVPLPWNEILFKLFLLIVCGYALIKTYKWFNSEEIKKRTPIRQSPKKMALRALKRLKLSPIWKNCQHKEICETLAMILKSFAQEQYPGNPGPSATTMEFISSLNSKSNTEEFKRECSRLLNEFDLIKYSDYKIQADHEKFFDCVQTLIENSEVSK